MLTTRSVFDIVSWLFANVKRGDEDSAIDQSKSINVAEYVPDDTKLSGKGWNFAEIEGFPYGIHVREMKSLRLDVKLNKQFLNGLTLAQTHKFIGFLRG